ncbi:MAG TPA: hypothetical protein VFQ61_12280 [Polyangiaceae bacterium]|nr:hypothetical protein [Polyangiaceae bacterium]
MNRTAAAIALLLAAGACSREPSESAAGNKPEAQPATGGMAGASDRGGTAGGSTEDSGGAPLGGGTSQPTSSGGANNAGAASIVSGGVTGRAGTSSVEQQGGTSAGSSSSGSAGSNAGAPAVTRPFVCGPSKSPMFQSQEPLTMRIAANFSKLNSAATAEESGSSGTIELKGAEGVTQLSAKVVARGNSRFRYCQVRPFSLKFTEKQKGNLFEHLGKSVKFVSHCVAKPDAPVNAQAPSLAAYEQRVLMEHTVYQTLDQLSVPSLKTRLVNLTYHDTQTDEEETHPAFVLEPEDEMAERCGMVKVEDLAPGQGDNLKLNQYGVLLLHLLNNFILQYDWDFQRNVIPLAALDRGEKFNGVYDFDLVAVIRPDYSKNLGRTLAENAAGFADWLRRNQSPALFNEVGSMLQRSDAMLATLQLPGLTEQNRALFTDWLRQFLPALEQFKACEGHGNDATRPACYVPDDHGASPDTASTQQPGEWTTRIEPPGDTDMFSLQLEANQLYSLGASMSLALRDDNGVLIAQSETIEPTSFRVPRSGKFYLEASMPGSSVVSPFHADPQKIDQSVYLYADDAGTSLDTAVPLSMGQAFDGKWELSTGWDQDWFLVHAEPGSSLHVTLNEPHNGTPMLVAQRQDGSDAEQELSLEYGDNDASSLLPEAGDYVLKLSHYGFDQPGTYRIEFK